jgi:hypothetical protein
MIVGNRIVHQTMRRPRFQVVPYCCYHANDPCFINGGIPRSSFMSLKIDIVSDVV